MNFKPYIAPVLKWWWLILGATLLAGVSSYFVTRPLPPVYLSTVTLSVGTAISQPNPDGGTIGIERQLSETYAGFVNNGLLGEKTREALGLDWLPDYSAVARISSQLVEISVVDTNPVRAQRVADELAHQLILMSPTGSGQSEEGLQAFINQQIQELQTNIQATQREIAQKQEEMTRLISASEIANLQGEITVLEARLTTLSTNFATLIGSTDRGASNSLRVIVEANLPFRPIGPNKPVIIVLSAVVGALLAVAAAFLLEFIDDTVKDPEEVSELLQLPMLASLPAFKVDTLEHELITAYQPRSHVSEAFRVLRTGIKFASLDKNNASILVTSSSSSEGKSMTSANLAVVLAQTGSRVLLIDADLRRPRQHHIFKLPNDRGLTSFLLELNVDDAISAIWDLLQSYIQPSTVEGLSVLTSGPLPPNPSELLGSTKMQLSLAALTGEFDYLVFDTTPILAVTDALVMATQVDNIILITRSGQTTRAQLRQVQERLSKMKGNVIGYVLNRWSPNVTSDYYYYDEQSMPPEQRGVSIHTNGRFKFPFPLPNPWRGRAKSKETKVRSEG